MVGPGWASVYYYATDPLPVRLVVEESRRKPFLAAKLQDSREFRRALRGSRFLPLIQSHK